MNLCPQAVDTNFREGVATWCYFDEFHVLLRDPLTASYFVAVWKMLRKKGCVPSALTQNVKDLLASREIENILDNTDFMILLSQAQSDRAILARQLGISEHQLSYITHSNSGEGLLVLRECDHPVCGSVPEGEIYDLLTTRPEDMKNEAKPNKPRPEAQTHTEPGGGAAEPGGSAFGAGSEQEPGRLALWDKVSQSQNFAKSQQEQAAASKLRMEKGAKNGRPPEKSWQSRSRPKTKGPIRKGGGGRRMGRSRLCAWQALRGGAGKM